MDRWQLFSGLLGAGESAGRRDSRGVENPKRPRRLQCRDADGSKVPAVARNLLANGRGRWLAVAVSLVVSGGMLYAQSADKLPHGEQAAPVAPSSSAEAPPTEASALPVPAEAELLAASAPAAGRDIPFELPKGVAPEEGLQVRTIWAARAISVMFPEITTIGGYRQDALRWHPEGLAIDVMIPDHNSKEA